jgi:AcrR family transcriptional regulator
MDNQTRSELSRKKAIDAALAILTRDGAGGLTFDALAKESGISKGGLLHQFRNKEGVLKALLDHQRQQFDLISKDYLSKEGGSRSEPTLAANIAMYRESINQPNSVARAMLAAMVESPELLQTLSAADTARMEKLEAEAVDQDLSLLRYFAASGLAFNTLLGLSKLTDAARNRLFDRLLDESSWQTTAPARKARKQAVR